MDPIQFKPSNVNAAYSPEQAIDFSQANQLNREQYSRDIARFASLQNINDQTRIQESARAGEDLIALGQFSEKALKVGTEILGEIQKENEINDMYDFLTGGGTADNAPDAPEVDAADREAEATATATNNVEAATGSAVVSEQFRASNTSPAVQQVVSERGALLQAQVAYGPYMQTYLSGNGQINVGGQTINIRDAIASGDTRLINAAIAQGRYQFIRDNGLGSVSRRNFVKILGNTILQTDASMGGRLAADAIAQRRKDDRKALEAQAYALAQTSTSATLYSNWREQSQLAYDSGAYQTRGAANEATTEAMLQGLAGSGNVDAINDLRDLQKRDGEAGTALGIQYGALFDKYEAQAITAQNRNEREAKEDIEQAMYQELAALGPEATPEQRVAVVERYQGQLEANGFYAESRELGGKITSLSLDGSKDVNFVRLQQDIATGAADVDDVNEAELRGDISNSQANTLRTQAGREGKAADEAYKGEPKEIATDWGDRFEADFLISAGLRKDPNGDVVLIGDDSLVSPGEAKIITGQVDREIEAAVRLALSQNPDVSGLEKSRLINETVQQWWAENVDSPTGRYRLPSEGTDTSKYTKADRDRFQRVVTNSNARASTPVSQNQRPIDWSGFTRHNGYISDEEARRFNPIRGDVAFTRADVEQMAEDFRKGKVDPRLIQYASKFRFSSPEAFLNQQLGAHGISPVEIRKPEIPTNAPLSGVDGARRLISLGFPTRGAAWLAGNIQTESGWYGGRPAWNDVGAPAGGLVSWRAGRLKAIESHYGKPIQNITSTEQLAYMLSEMRTKYPSAYRTFMNPYATPRQLEEASFNYWGWGTEGDRFKHADQIYTQLTK